MLFAFLTFASSSRTAPSVVSLILSVLIVIIFFIFFAVASIQSYNLAISLDKMQATQIKDYRLKKKTVKDAPELAACLFTHTAFFHESQLVPAQWWQACQPILQYMRTLALSYILVKLQGEAAGMLFAALLIELICLFSIIKSNI